MAINFPASPSENDTFTAGSITYKWDGVKWIGLGVTPTDRLVEGSNSLEINANNDLVWSGDSVLLGTATANVHDRLTIYDPGTAFMSIRSDVAADDTSQVLDFGVGTADRSSANLTGIIEADIHSTSGGTLKSDLVFSANSGDNISEKFRIRGDGKFSMGGAFTPGATLHIRDSNNTTMGVAQAKISKGIGSGAAPETITRENLYLHLGGSEWGSSANGSYLIGFGYTNGETGTGVPAYVGFNEDTTSGYTTGSLVFGTRPNNLGDNVGRERMRITEKGVRQYPCANDSSFAYQGIYQQLSGKKQLTGSGNFTDIVVHGHSCSYILQYYLLENDNDSLGGGPGTAYLHVRYGASGYTNHLHSVAGMNGGSVNSPEIQYVNSGSKLTFRASWTGANPVFLYWHLSGCGNTKLAAL